MSIRRNQLKKQDASHQLLEDEQEKKQDNNFEISNPNENVSLGNFNNPSRKKSCWAWLNSLTKDKQLDEGRTVELKPNQSQPSNEINNMKYNFITFLPLCLFEQFQLFSNVFFLAITISQLFDVLRVGQFITQVGPLCLVITIAIAKELIEDLQRMQRDRELNNQNVDYFDYKKKCWKQKQCKYLRVGDLIKVKDRVPADCIVVHTFKESSELFIKTDQLDGETDWKQKRAISSIFETLKTPQGLEHFQEGAFDSQKLEIEQPGKNIYRFSGKLIVTQGTETKDYGVDVDNCIWANTKVTSGEVMAVVVFTGRHCKMQMNMSKARFKTGKVDYELNYLIKITVSIMVALAMVMVVVSGFNMNSPIIFMRQILLFSQFIPISAKVNLDIAKLFYCYNMSRDPLIPGCVPRNYSIPEELSRVDQVFSDKTGTLTKNEMTLKRLQVYQGPDYDIDAEREHNKLKTLKLKASQVGNPFSIQDEGALDKGMSKEQRGILKYKNSLALLALCNNVNPSDDNGDRVLQASSPDEKSFVEFTDEIGFFMQARDINQIQIQEEQSGKQMTFEELVSVPFKSETKRMRIVIKCAYISSHQILMVKGAESEIVKLLKDENEANWLIHYSKELSKRGLRTLAFTYKWIPKAEYEDFISHQNAAMPEDREQYISKLERESLLCCLTGVEDNLQDQVAETISSLKQAGVKVWMLTGDKIETAKCIASSTDLKNIKQDFQVFESTYQLGTEGLNRNLNDDLVKCELHIDRNVLVVDGDLLEAILHNAETKYTFIRVSQKAPAVMVCRCSPTQKAQIVRIMKNETQSLTLSIGDGGNDVAMIQESHVGVGIFGKEGKQAALSSDFSILEFKHLKNLLFWHGRLGQNRTAALAQFIIHRGMLVTVVQLCFSLAFYNSPISIQNGQLMIGYSTVFTTLPILAIILDEDVPSNYALDFPDLQKKLHFSRSLSTKTFMIWIWKSVYQGSGIIMISVFLIQDNNQAKLVAISFSCLVLCEFLNVYSTVIKWHQLMTLSMLVSLFLQVAMLLCIDTSIQLTNQEDPTFQTPISLVTAIAWTPVILIKWLTNQCYPSDTQKLIRAEKDATGSNIKKFSKNKSDQESLDNDSVSISIRDSTSFNIKDDNLKKSQQTNIDK